MGCGLGEEGEENTGDDEHDAEHGWEVECLVVKDVTARETRRMPTPDQMA